MNEQLNLFSLMEAPDINDITEEQAVKIVGDRLGIQFKYNAFLERYEAKKGKMTMALSYGRFFPGVFDGRLFLGTDWQITDNGFSGGSIPADGIDEATRYLERAMREWT